MTIEKLNTENGEETARPDRALLDIPQNVCGQRSPDQGPAVTEDCDQFIEVFDLQSVVEGEAKPMRPVKERQRADSKQRKRHYPPQAARKLVHDDFHAKVHCGR